MPMVVCSLGKSTGHHNTCWYFHAYHVLGPGLRVVFYLFNLQNNPRSTDEETKARGEVILG